MTNSPTKLVRALEVYEVLRIIRSVTQKPVYHIIYRQFEQGEEFESVLR